MGQEPHVPWWRRDRYGWPIERIRGKDGWIWWLRVVWLNLRKVVPIRRIPPNMSVPPDVEPPCGSG